MADTLCWKGHAADEQSPNGWRCTRPIGHDGDCDRTPVKPQHYLTKVIENTDRLTTVVGQFGRDHDGCVVCAGLDAPKQLEEAITALRWIANNVRPASPATASARNTLIKMGIDPGWPVDTNVPYVPPGHDCSHCGASLEDCERKVFKTSAPCCGVCRLDETHGMSVDDWVLFSKWMKEQGRL